MGGGGGMVKDVNETVIEYDTEIMSRTNAALTRAKRKILNLCFLIYHMMRRIYDR